MPPRLQLLLHRHMPMAGTSITLAPTRMGRRRRDMLHRHPLHNRIATTAITRLTILRRVGMAMGIRRRRHHHHTIITTATTAASAGPRVLSRLLLHMTTTTSRTHLHQSITTKALRTNAMFHRVGITDMGRRRLLGRRRTPIIVAILRRRRRQHLAMAPEDRIRQADMMHIRTIIHHSSNIINNICIRQRTPCMRPWVLRRSMARFRDTVRHMIETLQHQQRVWEGRRRMRRTSDR